MKIKNLLWLSLVIGIMYSCNEAKLTSAEIVPPSEAFKQKWYAGKAEISSYILHQIRYGEKRNGEAVLIYVTEEFSTGKLVKLDEPGKTSDKLRVLKMNMTKNFVTGIYPYSMMLSVFTPVSKGGDEKTLKTNCSSQEWCGHTFSQLQLKGNNYNWQLHSYFEKEGEEKKTVDAVLMEDELWNRIRINPLALPTGKIKIIPGLLWQRLSHSPMQKEDAVLNLSNDSISGNSDKIIIYTIQYPSFNRSLKIFFIDRFPHEILGWEESYPDGFGNNKKMLTTTAVLKKSSWIDYWKHNTLADSIYRDTFQLMHHE